MFQNVHFPKYLCPESIRKGKETRFWGSKGVSYYKENKICKKTLQLFTHYAFSTVFCSSNIYLFKINNTSTRKRCGICSKFPIKIKPPEQCYWRRSGIVSPLFFLHPFLVKVPLFKIFPTLLLKIKPPLQQ